VSRTGAVFCIAASSLTGSAHAQVGLTSGLARVTLVARSALEGAVQSVSTVSGGANVPHDASLAIRMTANAGYSLVVRGVPSANTGRIWVRASTGEFQELKPGASVTVAREAQSTGTWEQQVHYRVDSTPGAKAGDVPVRLELRLDPVT
jgi:uncharacterized protein (DUF2235 family)